MELKGFREVLLKKAEGNTTLQTLIAYARDEIIIDKVLESLEKMARPNASMGRGSNAAVMAFANQLKNKDVEMMRDALGHHVSHYKSNLKAAQDPGTDPNKIANHRKVADQHLNKIIPLMHLAGKASKHSGGNLTIDYPSTTPWETNYTQTERLPNGKLKEGTKDLGRRPSPNANRAKNPRAVPDYRYLEMAPHPEHASLEKMPHKGGYPFEEIQLGHPMKRDAGQAYLPIEDVKDVKDYVPHPFDAHPVHQHADTAQHDLGPEQHEAINAGLAGWSDSEPHKQWMADQKSKHAADPGAYKARGTTKPGHPYEGVPLQEMTHHQPLPKKEAKALAEAVSGPAQEAPAKEAAPKKAQASDPKAIWESLNDDQKAGLAHLFPQFSGKK